jgi:DNA-binding GntR family transcriptional regulator
MDTIKTEMLKTEMLETNRQVSEGGLEPSTFETSDDRAIYQHLHQAIIERRLPPGTKLTEDVLCSVYSVSRSRIRKVLQQLSHERCVDLVPNRGAFVAEPSPKEARDVFAARRLLEANIIAQTSRHLADRHKERLERNITEERAAHERGDRSTAIRLSGEFHLLLAEAGNNGVIADMLRDLVSRTSLILALYGWESATDRLCSCEEHEAIMNCLTEKRSEDAIKLMEKHLRVIEAQLILDKPSESVDVLQVLQNK